MSVRLLTALLADEPAEDTVDALRRVLPRVRGAFSLVVLDEVQAAPELFRALRVLVDRPGRKARFLVLGSAAPEMVRRVSETLAGRVEFVEHAEGARLHEEGREQQGDGRERLLSARQRRDALDLLAPGLGHDLDARFQDVVGVGQHAGCEAGLDCLAQLRTHARKDRVSSFPVFVS